MDFDLLEKESHLKSKLDEYRVEVPDFPIKPKGWSRLINYLGSPAQDPLEPLVSSNNGMLALKVIPVAGSAGLVIAQLLLFI